LIKIQEPHLSPLLIKERKKESHPDLLLGKEKGKTNPMTIFYNKSKNLTKRIFLRRSQTP